MGGRFRLREPLDLESKTKYESVVINKIMYCCNTLFIKKKKAKKQKNIHLFFSDKQQSQICLVFVLSIGVSVYQTK